MASSFYFFTDVDLLQSQTSDQAFSPGSTYNDGVNNFDQFHITSTHTSSGTPSAYAVCDGVVLVQDAGNSLVNIILKPTSQPPFAFPKVKYFIYRGINASSLLDTNGTDVAVANTNDLTQSIWDSQTALNNANGTTNTPPKQALGIDITITGSIDPVFFRTNISFQLPVVKAGWKIGSFLATGYGFEVLIESAGFDPQLQDVRLSDFFVRVQQLSGSPSQADQFGYAHDKEAILNYVDPAAFFGNFYQFSLNTKDSSGTSSTATGVQVYDNVLKGANLTAISDGFFFNRTLTYLDIRNEINQSFNYFQNYGNNIQIAYDGTAALTTQNYYISGWPLLAINASSFTLNTSTSPNILRVSMPDGSGDNTLPLMYISTGFLSSTYPDEPKQSAKMINMAMTSGWSDETKLSLPNRDGLATTAPVSSYIRLKYFKQFDPGNPPQASSGTVLRAQNYLDHIFPLYSMKQLFDPSYNLRTILYENEVFYDSSQEYPYDLIGKIGLAETADTISLFLIPQIVRWTDTKVKELVKVNSEASNIYSDFDSYITAKSPSYTTTESYFELNDPTPRNQGYTILNKDVNDMPISDSLDETYILNLAKNLVSAIDISGFDRKYKIFIATGSLTNDSDSIGQAYLSADILLRGYETVGGVTQVKELSTGIKIYSYA